MTLIKVSIRLLLKVFGSRWALRSIKNTLISKVYAFARAKSWSSAIIMRTSLKLRFLHVFIFIFSMQSYNENVPSTQRKCIIVTCFRRTRLLIRFLQLCAPPIITCWRCGYLNRYTAIEVQRWPPIWIRYKDEFFQIRSQIFEKSALLRFSAFCRDQT